MPAVAPSSYRPPLPRANSMQPRSTSGLNTNLPAARSRLNLSRTASVCSVPTVIPESSIMTATTSTAGEINLFKDIGFRSRAFSEGANGVSQLQLQQQQVQSSRYKTELCRPFEENGKCKYSDKCQFAHGKHELRSLARHPKYKTELCRTFHTSGFCPYGPRCHFIHNTEDIGRPIAPAGSFSSQNFNQITSPMPVPTSQNSTLYQNSRPAQLDLIGKQYSTDSMGTYANSYSPNSNSPLNGSPVADILGSHVMSPLSPPVSGGRFFSNEGFQRIANMSSSFGYSDASPPKSTFDLLKQIPTGSQDFNDDTVFEGPLTPPDSDRESMTGSPSSRSPLQRLPIFRCLSHSD